MPPNAFASQVTRLIRTKAELFALLTSHTTIRNGPRERVARIR